MSYTNLPVLGPCQVLFGPKAAEVDLGKSHGGVVFRNTEESAPITHDQTGTGSWDDVIVGMTTEVEVALSEGSYDRLKSILSGATILSDGATPMNFALDVDIPLGRSMRDNAKRLILKPIINNAVSTDKHDWIYVPLAHPISDIEWTFDAENQRVARARFKGYPESAANPRMWFMGDQAQII